MDQRLLTPEQAAKYLGVTPNWLAKARHFGKGPRFTKLGRLVRYDRSDLDAEIEMSKRGSTSELDESTA